MAILITGGAGFIGSHCCKFFHQADHEVLCLDNLSMGHAWAVKWGPLLQGDLRDNAFLDRVFTEHDITAVVHFAACAYVGESMQDPSKYYHNNTIGSVNLLDAMVRHGVRDIVFSSTCASYGIPTTVPITEDTPQRPVNPYGHSKLLVEQILRWYGEIHGLCWAALRYFNVAGSDPDGEIGEDHDPETHLIPLAIWAAQGKRDALSIFGTDYPTPDGTAIRDYIHVWDLVAAHALALTRLQQGAEPFCANLGTGQGHSVRQVVDTVAAVTGLPVPHSEAERRAGDPPELVADPRTARELLGWQAQFPELVTMIEHAWNWYQNRNRFTNT